MSHDDEAVRMVADELRARHVVDRVESHVVVRVAEAIVSKLSRLEKSRVERAVEYAAERNRAKWPDRCIEREEYHRETLSHVLAILVAQDSSAGLEVRDGAAAAQAESPETTEPGGRSSPPPAEVKPSERILARQVATADWCRARPDPDVMQRTIEAILDHLDEQHARGRK